jgi:hypothetical protein
METIYIPGENPLNRYMNRKLGKKPARYDSRTLRLGHYLLPGALPALPPVRNYTGAVANWPMYLNDQLGDCVVAAALHNIQEWSGLTGNPVTPTDADALAIYEIFGYVPGNPSTDNGIDMLSFLNYWRKTGLMVGGVNHKIAGYVSFSPINPINYAYAINLFGNAFIGLELPLSAQNQNVWSVPGTLHGDGTVGSWGGHCVPLMYYHLSARFPDGVEAITWGQKLGATWYFLESYCVEAYALLSMDWIEKSGVSPSGLNLAALQADIAQI